MFFNIFVVEGNIKNVDAMDWSSDSLYEYTLKDVVRTMWSSEQLVEKPFLHGKRVETLGQLAGKATNYIVEAKRWSTACQQVEALLRIEEEKSK